MSGQLTDYDVRVCAEHRGRRFWFHLNKDGSPMIRPGAPAWIHRYRAADFPVGTLLSTMQTVTPP